MNTSCFACRGGECIALKPNKACCDGCRFFKTKRRATTDRKRAKALIAAKPLVQQEHIAEKYYQGAMPWRKEGKRNDKQGTVATVPPQPGDHGAAAAAG